VVFVRTDVKAAGVMPSPSNPRLVAFGRVVRKARRDLELSQEALADRAGIHPTHVGAIERATKDVQLTTAFKVADGLGLSPSELFARMEEQLGS
jgi:transcriptional regulator with XRE-family HTH domain